MIDTVMTLKYKIYAGIKREKKKEAKTNKKEEEKNEESRKRLNEDWINQK